MLEIDFEFELGCEAFHEGLSVMDNPYDLEEYPIGYRAWRIS